MYGYRKHPKTSHMTYPNMVQQLDHLCMLQLEQGRTYPILSSLSQFTNNPSPEHWTAVKRVFWYLNRTQDLGIIYRKDTQINPEGYTDADWGSNPVDRKSISGYTFLIGNGPITWTSKKQRTVALSSMEAEYMAASLATREAIWLQILLKELGFNLENPTTLYHARKDYF